MSSRKGKCPGCKTPKSNHHFGTPGKNCTGPSDGTEIQESETSDEPSTSVLLDAIRNLSSQMEHLQMQHNDLKKQVQSPQHPPVLADQASKSSQHPTPLTQIATPAANTTTANNTSLSEKLAQAAAKGEYIDFSDLLSTWNGCSFFFDDEWISSPHLELYTDACDSGFGAYFSGNWLYGSFADHDIPHSRSITFKELYAIAAAVHTWSDSLACRNILFHCDNLSVVHILSSGTSKCRHIMILLRFLFFTCAHHNIMLRAKHINGVDNNWADALSRSQVDKFLASCPMAARHPTPTTPLPLTSFK